MDVNRAVQRTKGGFGEGSRWRGDGPALKKAQLKLEVCLGR